MALHDRAAEQAVLVDQARRNQGVAEGDAAGNHDVVARLFLQRANLPTESPPRTVELSHIGSVMVEDTT